MCIDYVYGACGTNEVLYQQRGADLTLGKVKNKQ